MPKNNATLYCPVCSSPMQDCCNGKYAYCRICGVSYHTNFPLPASADPNTAPVNNTKGWRVLFPVLGAASVAFLPFPFGLLTVLVSVTILIAMQDKFKEDDAQNTPVAAGERFKTPDDLLNVFRRLPLTAMPLRAEAGEAMMQLDMLKRKQQAICAMLGVDHPFRKSADEAVQYILKNCRQIYFRLRYCDQNDLSLRKLHRTYLRGLLDDNARVLRDFERLVIEITQMQDGQPAPVPTLDVLADTLHSIRTGEPEFDPEPERRMIS